MGTRQSTGTEAVLFRRVGQPWPRIAYSGKHIFVSGLLCEASDRALPRAYGPRKILILRQRAEIYAAKGDKESAKKTLNDAIAYAKALPAQQLGGKTIASLEKKLSDLSQ